MDQNDYIGMEEMIEEHRKKLGDITRSGQLYSVVSMGIGLLIMILICIMRILWQIKKDNDENASRVNDGVNCLGRLEELLCHWSQR